MNTTTVWRQAMKVSLPLVMGCLAALVVTQQGCVPEAPSSAQRKQAPEEVAALPVGKPRAKQPVPARKKWIPREVLFGNPDKAAARIGPDGAKLSYLAPVEGVLNV